jgi:micrococcal nuclease
LTDRRKVIFHIIKRGFAWYYRHYAKELKPEDALAYERAENYAKSGKRGLWADASPTPPWDFRRGKTAKAPGEKPAHLAHIVGPSVVGNRNSKIYHLPNCPDYSKVSARNQILFETEGEAQAAGYRKAKNCP